MSGLAVAFVLCSTPVSAAQITIAALGDSLTQGYGLPNGQGFVPRLEAWLKKRDMDVKIVNAGVSGDTSAGGKSRVAWTLAGGADAMIVMLGGNDLLRGLSPAQTRNNLEFIVKTAKEKGVPVLIAGLDVPGNFGGEYEQQFEAIYPDLAKKYDTLYFKNFLGPLSAELDLITAFFTYMQPDGLHPNAAGVEVIVEGIGPLVQELVRRATK